MAGKKNREIVTSQLSADNFFDEDLFLGPNGDRREKTENPLRGELHVRGKQPVKLQKAFLVKDRAINIRCRIAAIFKTSFQRFLRELRVMLLARKPLLLSGEDDLPVPDQADGAVVVKRRDP